MAQRNEANEPSDEFKRFRALAQKLIRVPKREVDEKRLEYERKKKRANRK
jgi:hypothetical protein